MVLTIIYGLQIDGRVKRLNRAILVGIRHHVLDHPVVCDSLTDLLTFG